jgi:sporulation protein YlmC with PRC-barrel domain
MGTNIALTSYGIRRAFIPPGNPDTGMTYMLRQASLLGVLTIASIAVASAQTMNSVPASSTTITNWYKQSVYDPKDAKIGTIDDVLVDKSGKITAAIVGVGGFLGVGEKDVAVPMSAIKVTTKDNNKWYLVMNATKDQLKAARGYKYDRDTTTWAVDKDNK